jgi:hypothetical protein
MTRLHDPGKMLPLPKGLASVVRQRVAAVNQIVDEAHTWPGVMLLDLASIPALQRPGGWSTDRIHPSRAGRQAIAAFVIAVDAPVRLPEAGLVPIARLMATPAVATRVPAVSSTVTAIAGAIPAPAMVLDG